MTATPIQMGAALSAVVNGGTYYQPRLVDRTVGADGQVHVKKPKVLKEHVVSARTGQDLLPMMRHTVDTHAFRPGFDQDNYMVGGKTGTAQIAKPGGGYYEDQFNGTYMGFVGGDEPEYVIVVFVHKPKVAGYAGSQAAQPIFGDLAHMLINNSYVLPRHR
jgi:cell division protein FtsI/penicillin-binding protein 2